MAAWEALPPAQVDAERVVAAVNATSHVLSHTTWYTMRGPEQPFSGTLYTAYGMRVSAGPRVQAKPEYPSYQTCKPGENKALLVPADFLSCLAYGVGEALLDPFTERVRGVALYLNAAFPTMGIAHKDNVDDPTDGRLELRVCPLWQDSIPDNLFRLQYEAGAVAFLCDEFLITPATDATCKGLYEDGCLPIRYCRKDVPLSRAVVFFWLVIASVVVLLTEPASCMQFQRACSMTGFNQLGQYVLYRAVHFVAAGLTVVPVATIILGTLVRHEGKVQPLEGIAIAALVVWFVFNVADMLRHERYLQLVRRRAPWLGRWVCCCLYAGASVKSASLMRNTPEAMRQDAAVTPQAFQMDLLASSNGTGFVKVTGDEALPVAGNGPDVEAAV